VTALGETVNFDFITPRTGWAAVSTEGQHHLLIYATTDGAKSWRQVGVITDLVNPAPVVSLRFFDPSNGLLAFTSDALVYRTADGGRSWNTVGVPPGAVYVDFVDLRHGWASTAPFEAGTTDLYATSDGGATWGSLPDLPTRGYPVFRSAAEGWIAGPAGSPVVFTSRDAGESWVAHGLPLSPCTNPKTCGHGGAGPGSVELLPGRGAIVTDPATGDQLVSFDLGVTWRRLAPPPGTGDYSDISLQDASHWWVIRGNVLYKTSDAGQTWTVVSDSIMYDSLQPTILDAKHAWVMFQTQDDSQPGRRANTAWELDVTSDGGLHWTTMTVPVPG
jgi:photosystem II stability/assembly factor-like uncharacterized protein